MSGDLSSESCLATALVPSLENVRFERSVLWQFESNPLGSAPRKLFLPSVLLVFYSRSTGKELGTAPVTTRERLPWLGCYSESQAQKEEPPRAFPSRGAPLCPLFFVSLAFISQLLLQV